MTPLETVSDDEPTAPGHGRPAPAGSFALIQDIGGLLVIEPGVAHDVRALTDSAFLLSMPWSEHAEG